MSAQLNMSTDQILKMRDENRAVLLISADLDELFRLSDRIVVLHRGQIVANLRNRGNQY